MTDVQREHYEDERQEERQGEDEENSCPCCGYQLSKSEFLEDGRKVESGVSCPCGYASGTSYGANYLELPDGWTQNDQGDIISDGGENLEEDL